MPRGTVIVLELAWVSPPAPGVVAGLGLILQATTQPGDEVVVFPPAYHAFRKIIMANGRRSSTRSWSRPKAATAWTSTSCASR